MLGSVNRSRRDSTLFQFTTNRLRDFIDPNHLPIRIDERFDFGRLVSPLEDRYCDDNGRPAIHSEVLIRALLICSLYNVASFRRLSFGHIGEHRISLVRQGWRCGSKARPGLHPEERGNV
ncbi:MAG: hypothetical protein OXS35_00750 [Dehalococcoidia bacterium]|nr:hypothetical protein [Dehalococcoidia bacterium]